MAGSFDIFRKYQRSLLVAVAILAMLAFFVLPPILQMGAAGSGGDPVAASWQGSALRESGLARAVAMRTVLNQFLLDAVAVSGRDPGRMRLLPDDEEDVVRTMLLAREADANGVVVSNAAINDFLGEWTNDMVRPEQFEALIARRQGGPIAASQADIFEALRQVLAANRMERMFLTGFAGDPPGLRWDYFRRLEQEATVEVVPVVVEQLAGDVPAPNETTLRTFFDAHKEDLPAARSPDPGFREPRRISYESLAAARADLEAAAAKDVTDEQVRSFYDENKERLYRAKAEEGETQGEPAASKIGAEEEKKEKPAAGKSGDDAPAEQKKPADEASDPQSRATTPTRVRAAAFRQPATEAGAPAAEKSAAVSDSKGVDSNASDLKDGVGEKEAAATASAVTSGPSDAGGTAAEKRAEAPAADQFEPLEKVATDIRQRLAGEAAGQRIDAVFEAVVADVGRYAEDRALWQAKITKGAAPVPPDVVKIAEKQGLTATRVPRVTASDALAAGGIAASFDFREDPNSPMGFRQDRWIDLMFGGDATLLRPVATRDVAGNRYLSWKTEELAPFVPSFESARSDVERAWRIVEARPLARKLAEEIAAAAGGNSLGAVVAEKFAARTLETVTVGPFTWLGRNAATFGAPPTLAQPEGLAMPGVEFMQTVFGLEPGGTAVAFNQPRTVCYVIRLVEYRPDETALRQRFLDASSDERRLLEIARQEESEAVSRWIEEIERRYALDWKRPPRRSR
jgi:hypothetical protein